MASEESKLINQEPTDDNPAPAEQENARTPSADWLHHRRRSGNCSSCKG